MDDWQEVSKDELVKFVREWPNKLDYDVATICEPPLGNYNDFSDGKEWPESMVAKIEMDWLGPNKEIDRTGHKRFWKYYIKIQRSAA